MDPCPHCLRPSFTARLGADLDRGAAINLIAAPGQGAGRLLADLQGLPGRGPRLVANLKRHRHSLAALVADLWSQTGLDGHPPTSLGGLTDRLERNAPGAALLLHRFDALLDNPDLDGGGRALLAAAVLADPRPLDLLDRACRRLRDGQYGHLALNERLARWGGELEAERGRVGPRSAVRVRHLVQTWWVASGVGKVLPVKRLAAWIGGLFAPAGRKKG